MYIGVKSDINRMNVCHNILDSQLLAPPAGKVKGANFPTSLGLTSINISHCFYHTFPSVSAHSHQAKCTHRLSHTLYSDYYCVGPLCILVHTKARFECRNAVWYAVISRGAFHQAFCQCFSLTNLLSANQMQGFQ